MKKVLQKIQPPLNLVLFFIATSIPVMIFQLKYILNINTISEKAYGLFFIVTIFASAFIWATVSNKSRFIKYFCIILSIMISALDICCLWYYNSVFNTIFFQLIADTNYREAKEFLLSNHTVSFFIVTILFYTVLYKKISTIKSFVSYMMFYPVSVILIMIPIVSWNCESNNSGFPLSRMVSIVSQFIEYNQKVNHFKENFNTEAEILENNSTIPNVVFVLGESATKTHMSLYNYKKETNPLLKNRDLFIYQNVTSPDTVTMSSIKQIFTYYNNESDKEWFEYPNMFDILNKAGYKTFWLSNQERIGYTTNVQETLSSRCNITEYLVKNTDFNPQNYDEKLLPLLDKYQTDKKSFYLIHLAGSHCIYKNRYPENFAKYEGLIGEYDNSILYTDYVIDEIIKKFENKNAIVIYLSDHGEEVSEKEKCGHYPNGGDAQKQIPMLIWISDQFRQSYPDKVLQLQKNIYTPINTGDIIHGLLNLLDIKTKDYKKDKDIFAM